jgi:CheY-like chemotaxis protein
VATVLVVDDELGIVESLSEILGEEGFTVLVARNGKDALRRLAEATPDIVLLDYMMPVLDGRDTLAAIRSHPRLSTIPVLMMSAMPKSSLPADCQPTAFLRKPFDIDVLLTQIRALIASR